MFDDASGGQHDDIGELRCGYTAMQHTELMIDYLACCHDIIVHGACRCEI
jgi:hypothetical protein